MQENLMEKLNEEQLKAVTHRDGPLMIIAGAGTGKTMAITQRIAWLIEQKLAAPDEILALTFTEKAAAEMEERVDILLPMGYVDLWISTFHSFCERILSDYGIEIGLGRNMRVLNEVDTWLLMRQNFDRFELEYYRPKGNPTKFLKALLTHFSRAKDEVITPEDYLKFAEQERANLDATNSSDDATAEVERLTELANTYHTYQQILLENDSLDFGDLIGYTLELLQKRPKVLAELQKKFKYVLVDEFQDTNWAQYELVKLLTGPDNNLTVVGDDDQSIYKFRGASLSNILQFEQDYPDTEKIVLTKNYRTVQSILDHAYKFIQMNNPNRLEREGLSKELASQLNHEGKIEHLHYVTLEQEIEGVADQIMKIRTENPDALWSDFGILVRANDAANDFLSALERRGIPYQFLALRGLYTKPTVMDLVAYLNIIDNPYNSPAWYRLLTHPMFDISHEEIAKLNLEADKAGKTSFDILKTIRAVDGIKEETASKIENVISITNELSQEAKTKNVTEIIVNTVQKTGLLEWINGLDEQTKHDSFRYLHQFFERVKRFEARHDHPVLKNFLAEFEHERSAGEEGSLQFDIETGPDTVKIMTVHGSKGLEFKYIFVTNLIDRRFPTSERKEAIPLPDGLIKDRVPEGDVHLEEERRLFYVAVTRAKDELYLTSAEDYGGVRKRKMSRFLHEIGLINDSTKPTEAVGPFEDPSSAKATEGKYNKITYQLPKQFSFTQIRAFNTCPLQYKFAHLLKIPVLGKYQMSFGKTMHNTLQEYFRRWIERTKNSQQDLFGEGEEAPTDAIPVGVDELLEIYKEHWIDEWYPNDGLREEYRATGRKTLKDFYKQIETEQPKPIALEAGFTLKHEDLVIKGRIDRIDEAEGGVEIIDYKTGKPKEKLTFDDKEQLLIYQLAAAESLGYQPVKLTFHYLEDNSQISFLGTEKELDKLRDKMNQFYDKIKASKFDATPGFSCQFCDFKDICEFRKL